MSLQPGYSILSFFIIYEKDIKVQILWILTTHLRQISIICNNSWFNLKFKWIGIVLKASNTGSQSERELQGSILIGGYTPINGATHPNNIKLLLLVCNFQSSWTQMLCVISSPFYFWVKNSLYSDEEKRL